MTEEKRELHIAGVNSRKVQNAWDAVSSGVIVSISYSNNLAYR